MKGQSGFVTCSYLPTNNTNTPPHYNYLKDPKTSRWLWDLRERARQKKRTENYRQIMRLQQDAADPLATIDLEEMNQATRKTYELLTRLSDSEQMSNYLSYGQWDLSESDIERLQKDEEMKQRVRQDLNTTIFKIFNYKISPKEDPKQFYRIG